MPVTIVAGAQWGDEGKGRIVDLLAREADIVIRCQGGPNAGHTVINERGRFVLHSVPSGILNPGVRCIIGAGTVINPAGLVEELQGLIDTGVDIGGLLISERANLIMPYHPLLERLDEQRRGAGAKIGSTGRGIAPAYVDKAARRAFRACDLLDLASLRGRLADELIQRNRLFEMEGQAALGVDEAMAEIEPAAAFLAPFVGDTVEPIADSLSAGKRVMLEGQLGVMRDLDWGAYPFVTSSSPTPAGMLAGAGVPPGAVDRIIGVVKAYTSAVGAGPFPTELDGAQGEMLREVGKEYGATTGRPRRCGWFDAVAVAWAMKVAGFTEIALTKIDVLDGIDRLPMCTSYRDRGQSLAAFPTTEVMARVEPVYEESAGWSTGTSPARTMDALPAEARSYIDEIERRIAVPISMVSVGPERDSIIARA